MLNLICKLSSLSKFCYIALIVILKILNQAICLI
nr:MAG TPA: hypothetical protein [Inoviridae sp.]